MAHRIALLALLAVTACEVAPPPPPVLTVTSPQRGTVASELGRIRVTGTAVPGESGDAVESVTVNGTRANLASDGSFEAFVDVPAGAMLLETVAVAAGSAATDARAVQTGQMRPVGGMLDKAITASVSADAFAKLSAAAGPLIRGKDLAKYLSETKLGSDAAYVKVNVQKLVLGDAKLSLTPVDGGLAFTAEISALDVLARANFGGPLVPDDASNITVTADKITIAGTFTVTPAGITGFKSALASPTINTTNLKLKAGGVTGAFLTILQSELLATVRGWIKSTAEGALGPLINDALGALGEPRTLDILGKPVTVEVSPAGITFSRAGALVSLNLASKIGGGEASPGFIYTPNGTPSMTVGKGIQLGLADDLVNQLLAQIHALGLLELQLEADVGIFDTAKIKTTIPPMISANNPDGKLRLVLGDMVASFSNNGKPVISAAINASVDLEILRGNSAKEIAFEFGEVKLFVNILEDATGMNIEDLSGPATGGISLQLAKLEKFLVTVPVPSVAGVTLDSLALRADNGYVLVSGQVH